MLNGMETWWAAAPKWQRGAVLAAIIIAVYLIAALLRA